MEDIILYEKLQSDLIDCSRKITQKAVKIGEMFDISNYSDFIDQVAEKISKVNCGTTLYLERQDDSRYSDIGDVYYFAVPLKYFEMTEEELKVVLEEYKIQKDLEEKEHKEKQKIGLKIALETQIKKKLKQSLLS